MADEKVVLKIELDKGDLKALGAKIDGTLSKAGKKGSESITKNIKKAGKKGSESLSNDLKKAGQKGGKSFGSAFQSSVGGSINLGSIFKGTLIFSAINTGINAVKNAFRSLFVDGLENARQFQKGIAEINTLLPETQRLTSGAAESIRDFAGEFGTRQAGQARAFYNIVSAGVKGVTNQLTTLGVANRAAVAGLVDINTSARVLVSSVNSYAKSGLIAEQASDQLFVAVREGITTFGELADSIGTVAPIAASAGIKFSELTGALAAITKAGVKTDIAAVGLRQIMVSIIKPTAEAQETASRLGLEFNTAALRTKGFAGFLKDLGNKTGGSEIALAKLFGNVRALAPILNVVNGNFDDFTRILKETENAAGATSKAAAIMNDTLNRDIEKRNSAWERFTTIIGEGLTPAYGALTRGVTSFLNTLGGAKAPETISKLSKVLDGLIERKADLQANGATLFGKDTFDNNRLRMISRAIDGIKARIENITTESGLGDAVDKTAVKVASVADTTKNALIKQQEILRERLRSMGVVTLEELNIQEEIRLMALSEAYTNRIIGLEEFQNQVIDIEREFENKRTQIGKKGAEKRKKNEINASGIVASAISRGTQELTKNLIVGSKGFGEFGKSILNIGGDMATQLGTMFIGTGVAIEATKSLGGAGAIAAGVGLVAVGTIMKSLSGGGGSTTPAIGGGSDATTSPSVSTFSTQDEVKDREEPGQRVNVVINGNVLDSDESGLRIIELIEEAGFNSGAKVLA